MTKLRLRPYAAGDRPAPGSVPVSVVVLAQDEEDNIARCLASVAWAAQVVVVDSGSAVSIGNPALLKLLTRRSLIVHPPETTQIVDVTGHRLTIEQDQIADADVGGVVIHNMSLAFAPLPIFDYLGLADTPALFLGMDILSQCERVSVDIRRREATFTLR